ncbi:MULTISPECIES: hypothetical protein [unclassified Streptomyces]|nr:MULTISPECIES: hypothetical protein [unclassified Streptomyces]WRZ77833.1 hypothetical protein OG251_40270 [Streptomyces sp. NBC_01237]
MQKDIINNDPLTGDEESRKPGISITITVPIRNAEDSDTES